MNPTKESERISPDSSPNKTVKVLRSVEERRAIVEESLRPGVRVVDVARRHGIKASQIYQWRKLCQEGRLGLRGEQAVQLVPVTVVHASRSVSGRGGGAHGPAETGAIQIQFPRAEVRVEGSVDAMALRLVLECLRA